MAAKKKKKASPTFHPALAAINAFDMVEGLECASLKAAERVADVVSTGSFTADLILGGGFPRGKFITIFGPEGCGKSTFLQEFMVSLQHLSITIVHYDFETGSDPVYMTNQGIDLDHKIELEKRNKDGSISKKGVIELYPDFLYSQPDYGEQAYRHILMTLKQLPPVSEGLPQIAFIVDSFAAMPSEEIDEETGDSRISPNARMHSHFIQLLRPKLKRKGALLIGSNQTRTMIGSYGSPQMETGGNAIRYYPDQKIMISRKKIEADKTKLDVLPITIRTIKNKVFIPHRVAEGMGIVLGRGIDRALDASIFLEKTGHLEIKRGLRKVVFPKKETKFMSWAEFRRFSENPRFRDFLRRKLKRNKTFKEYLETDGPANYFYDQDFTEYDDDNIDPKEIKRMVDDEAEEYREERTKRRRRGKRGKGRSKRQSKRDRALEEEE
jgi:recombination protein RecA